MASTESIAALFGFGTERALQPPRFAKVTEVTDDAVTVTLGTASAEAVRCCVCAVGDVVLLETMPNGTLAAVGTRGAAGGGGVQSFTIGTVAGATMANSGTATDVVLDFTPAGPWIIESGTSDIWTYRKWSDGTAECWGRYETSFTGWESAWSGGAWRSYPGIYHAYPSGLFVATPVENGNLVSDNHHAWFFVEDKTGSATQTKTYRLTRPTTGGAGASAELNIYAVGRWK